MSLSCHRKLGAGEHEGSLFDGPMLPPLRELNIGKLLDEQRSLYSDNIAAVSRWQGISLTYQSLYNSSRSIAHSLLLHGVRPKDRVVVLAGNAIEYIQLFFAVGGIGAIFAILNPTFTLEEAAAAVDFLDPAAIFIADRIGYRNNKGLIAEISQKRGHASLIVQMGKAGKEKGFEDLDKAFTWQQFLEDNPIDNQPDLLEQHWAHVNAHDTLCIQFTSGTTGPRKAAMLTHRNLLNNALLVGERLDFTPNDVICCCVPTFHCFGLICGILAAVMHGSAVVLPSDVFMAETSLQAISGESCTVIHAVPTMFQALLDNPRAKKYSPKFSLRTGIIAGSSLSRTLLTRLAEEFRLKGLAYAFGQTELSAVSFMTTPSNDSLLDDHSSVGVVLPHVSAKVVDSELENVPPGGCGELLVSGFLVFQGYYNNPEKTREALVTDAQGRQWLRTGDLVRLDASGKCTVIGRLKDMIKRGGESIFPGDIEKVLEQHPDVAAAAVIGVPDTQWGEVIGAFVQRTQKSKSESRTAGTNFKVWLRNRIASHKIPQYVFWIGEEANVPDELPVNSTGKLMKKELREIAVSLAQEHN